jgi:hypothetical protein
VRDLHRVTLVQERHRWTFTYTEADAPRVLARVTELAADPDAALTESDARLLRERIAGSIPPSFQVPPHQPA